jgi:hypothetical protein
MNQHLATNVYAKSFDLTHVAQISGESIAVSLYMSPSAVKRFYRCLPELTRISHLNSQGDGQLTPLMSTANIGDVEAMRTVYRDSADLKVCNHTQGTALMIACRVDQLLSVKCLIRLGANIECSTNGHTMNALDAARDNHKIIRWFLVDRYVDREAEIRRRLWSGVRTVEIPLKGIFERPESISLLEAARGLHRITRDGWRVLVPLGWNPVAHFVPLPSELKKRNAQRRQHQQRCNFECLNVIWSLRRLGVMTTYTPFT